MVARYPEELDKKFVGSEFEETVRLMTSRKINLRNLILIFDDRELAVNLWQWLVSEEYIDPNGIINEELFKSLNDNPLALNLSEDFQDKRDAIFSLLKNEKPSGSPDEIKLERLRVQKDIFEYVMTDLVDKGDMDLFDPQSLSKGIPGFMEDPTMQDYLHSLKSIQLRRTLEYFFPLYNKAETIEGRSRVLELATLFYQTGELSDLRGFLDLLDHEDPKLMELVSTLNQIPNKYARKKWVSRIKNLLQKELPQQGVQFQDLIDNLGNLLSVDANFLVLPVYYVSKAYENGPTLSILSNLVNEISETYRKKIHQKKIAFYDLSQWLLSVDITPEQIDARDDLKEVLMKYGTIFNDQSIDLGRRLEVLELLLRTIRIPHLKDVVLELAKEGDLDSFVFAVEEAVVRKAVNIFNLDVTSLRKIVKEFPAFLTALDMQMLLKNGENYHAQANGLEEILKHIVAGDFMSWRNQQVGDREFGPKVRFMESNEDFWNEFTKEETVQIDGFEITLEKYKKQIVELANQIQNEIKDDPVIIKTVDGQLAADRFNSFTSTNERLESKQRRSELAKAKALLAKTKDKKQLTAKQVEAIAQEDISLGLEVGFITDAIGKRLEDYSRLDDWIDLSDKLRILSNNSSTPKDLIHLRTLIARLAGRSLEVQLSGFSDQLESLLSLLNYMHENIKYNNITVQFTSRPELIIERGMLRPELTNCFNSYADPRQISTLIDDLGSRNKMLAIVRDEEGRILSVAVLKVKRLENGNPVLFLEQPLNLKGYSFESEMLEAIKKQKLPNLTRFNVKLAYEVKNKEKAVLIYETGGYGESEYFEPLFGVRKHSEENPVYHMGELVDTAADEAMTAKPSFDFVGSLGYQNRKIDEFIRLLKEQGVEYVVDVRGNAFSYRPEYSQGNLRKSLEAEGFKYVHFKDLGAPKEIRGKHDLGENDDNFMLEYEKYFLASPIAQAAFSGLKKLKGKRICLFCYEASVSQCHRSVILKNLVKEAKIKEPVVDLSAPLLPLEFSQILLNKGIPKDMAMIKEEEKRGGIDLTTAKVPLEVKAGSPIEVFGDNSEVRSSNQSIKFNIDPAMIEQLKNAQGFVPVIINLEPIRDLRGFLGLTQEAAVAAGA